MGSTSIRRIADLDVIDGQCPQGAQSGRGLASIQRNLAARGSGGFDKASHRRNMGAGKPLINLEADMLRRNPAVGDDPVHVLGEVGRIQRCAE